MQQSVFIEELLEWLRTSKHAKAAEGAVGSSGGGPQTTEGIYAKQEIMKLQALYYEERRKVADMQSTI